MSISVVSVVKDAVSWSGAVSAVFGAVVHKVASWAVAFYKKAKADAAWVESHVEADAKKVVADVKADVSKL